MQADYAEEESSINSIAFTERTFEGNGNGEASGGMLLATGGEDGMLRVWELRADRSEWRVLSGLVSAATIYWCTMYVLVLRCCWATIALNKDVSYESTFVAASLVGVSAEKVLLRACC